MQVRGLQGVDIGRSATELLPGLDTRSLLLLLATRSAVSSSMSGATWPVDVAVADLDDHGAFLDGTMTGRSVVEGSGLAGCNGDEGMKKGPREIRGPGAEGPSVAFGLRLLTEPSTPSVYLTRAGFRRP